MTSVEVMRDVVTTLERVSQYLHLQDALRDIRNGGDGRSISSSSPLLDEVSPALDGARSVLRTMNCAGVNPVDPFGRRQTEAAREQAS